MTDPTGNGRKPARIRITVTPRTSTVGQSLRSLHHSHTRCDTIKKNKQKTTSFIIGHVQTAKSKTNNPTTFTVRLQIQWSVVAKILEIIKLIYLKLIYYLNIVEEI